MLENKISEEKPERDMFINKLSKVMNCKQFMNILR